jgi:hypothetical protein
MKRLPMVMSFLLAVLAAACSQGTSPRAEPGWITLLDGSNPKTLDNWNRIGNANWRAEDGLVVADKGKGGYLVSKNSYRDFQIRAEFWADHATNSGIFLRVSDPDKIGSKTAYEVNIYDEREDPTYGTGAIVNFATVSPMPKAGGKWNSFEITAKGSELVVVMNGTQTAKANSSQFAQGPIALQYGSGPKNAPGGAIKWRRVQIKPL